MKIFQVSDIHGRLDIAELIPERAEGLKADLIVIAGDITHFGGAEEAEEVLRIISRAKLPIFFVSGNCDPPDLLSWRPKELNAKNLHGSTQELMGVVFIGVGGGSGKFKTLTELEEEEFEEILRKFEDISGDFVLVSHSPPWGLDVDFTGVKHIGSKAIRRVIEDRQPILMCTGHAHEGRGVAKLGRTTIVNAGPAKNGYCALISLEEGAVEVELLTIHPKD